MLKKTNKNLYSQCTRLFKTWRAFDASAAFFSMSGIVTSTVDYELNYSPNRKWDQCDESYLHSEGFRWATMLFTGISLIFILLRYYYKHLWMASVYEIRRISINTRAYSRFEYRKKKEVILEFIILSIFPYPQLTTYIHIPIRHNFETVLVCYTVAEILYCIMLCRFFLLIRAISNYTSFQDDRARLSCYHYKTKANFFFSFKCLLAKYPLRMVSLLSLFLIFFSAISYRVFERPLDDFIEEYNSDPFTALWYIFETISTAGYGDVYPFSYPGRTIGVIAYAAGAVIFTLFIVKMQSLTELTQSQDIAFTQISKSKTAAKVLRTGIQYIIYKKKYGVSSTLTKKQYELLIKSTDAFKKYRNQLHKINYSSSKALEEVKNSIDIAKIQARVCKIELNKLIETFS
ncbi:hypothetical protein SteCoe_18135 [Stentor coeruleus]|uniref:Potassium channel domain-containing protein n=1 Tax=Stentor coeruleus TaxID=5963 RepID=A0A1R2BX63_9CILI|nr:hypothetical protein SteCoe_18135 [Stentor coeruleus]